MRDYYIINSERECIYNAFFMSVGYQSFTLAYCAFDP